MTARAPVWAVALALALAGPRIAFGFEDTKAEAGACGIASVGAASNNNITCNNGPSPEQLKALIDEVIHSTSQVADIGKQLGDTSKRLGVTEEATKTLLRIVGEDPNIPVDKLGDALAKVAADYKRLQTQVAALNPGNPTARGLVDQAKAEIDAGHLEHAHELLQQATRAQLAAAKEAEKLQQHAHAAREAELLGAASSTAVEADVALTERDYLHAAELFGEAAGYVPVGHADEHGSYLLRQGDALFRQGDERGDNGALQRSIDIYDRALADYPRERAPLDWAATQNNLGNALATLGERESGTAQLDEAVAAYREALKEYTCERAPLDWAMTQDNLGNALETLGERESGTARLNEAVAAHREALKERTRERAPLGWAGTQNNLGNALETLGERESGTARLDEADQKPLRAVRNLGNSS